ncbi:putative membrane protein SpoIIM required for sporulation [Prauserella shujinwangii]|uniref:Putative membrane protein SpoIIM required for sporulation n=1 Tax=Prauserella shujinwangii TaxID=1453103 RepID=A0A2T0LM65_9PSEU|nr:stage II sporulation protein M [Prauserella shujinwangii]PRX44178.1 putative membrane protein SpoIIM required for sporulation [Prauserella shujinwangii]
MDLDVFVAAHRAEWDRLAELVRRSGRLRGPEADELVRLYQRAATHLSIVRSSAPDPAVLARLSALVAKARSAVTGTHNPAWREVGLFFSRRFPAAVYRGWPWWVATTVVFLGVTAVLSAWIAGDEAVRATIAAPEEIRAMTRPGGGYEAYYSSEPAGSFATQVWTNNARVAAASLVLGVLLGLPVLFVLWTNALNLAVGIGLMTAAGRGEFFLGLLAPHGLLELTAVFVAAGTGLRLGWTVIDPGRRSRSAALAREGRSVVVIALGLVVVLLVSGLIEAFVTPSGLPTWARVGIGVAAEAAFLAYVFVLGRRAAAAGETGDLDPRAAGDEAPARG